MLADILHLKATAVELLVVYLAGGTVAVAAVALDKLEEILIYTTEAMVVMDCSHQLLGQLLIMLEGVEVTLMEETTLTRALLRTGVKVEAVMEAGTEALRI